MRKIVNPSPFIKDIAFTTITSIATTFSIIIVTRLLAQGLGPEGFGAYSLARRVLSTIIPFSTLSMGVAVARYIAISKDYTSRHSYLLSGLLLGVVPSCVVLIIGLIFTHKLTLLIFRSEAYLSLLIATLVLIIGYSFYSVLYAFYRGLGKMNRANLWQLSSAAIGPVVVAILYANSQRVDLIIFLMAMCFFITLAPLIFYSYKSFSQNNHTLKIKGCLKELFQYGLPRVPGGFLLAGIISVGPFLAPYFGTLKEAGYLAVGQSVFRVVEGGLVAFGLVALPKVAQLFTEGKNGFLKERITDLIALVFHLGLFATLHLLLWSDQIVSVWLGNQYLATIPLMRIILIALVPYLAYVTLRSVIDAVEVKAVNTFNLGISFAIAVAISILLAKIGLGAIGLAIGTTIGLLSVGVLTIFYMWKIYRFKSGTLMIKKCLWLNAIFIAVAFSLKFWVERVYSGITLIGIAILIEGILLFLYCIILWKLGTRWILELETRIIRGDVQ